MIKNSFKTRYVMVIFQSKSKIIYVILIRILNKIWRSLQSTNSKTVALIKKSLIIGPIICVDVDKYGKRKQFIANKSLKRKIGSKNTEIIDR